MYNNLLITSQVGTFFQKTYNNDLIWLDAMSSRNMPAYSGGHAPPGKIGIRQIINGVGIITAILNENFAIIQFKAGHDEIR